MNILFAFLNERYQEILGEYIKEEKYIVNDAYNKNEILEIFDKKLPEIIVTHIAYLNQIKEFIFPLVMSLPAKDRPYIFIICEPNQRKSAITSLGILLGDYLLTPLDKLDVTNKLKLAIESHTSYQAIEENNFPVLSNSIYDSYLGIFNQNTIFEYLLNEINRIKRIDGKLSIIILEINELNYIEKSFGHVEMYNALRYISQILKVNIRLSDLIGTWVNHRFILILPNCDQIHVEAILKRISETTYSLPIKFKNSKTIPLTFSAGYSNITAETKTPPFLLINQACEEFISYENIFD